MLAGESISLNLDFSPSLHMSLSLVMECTPFLSLVLTFPRSLPLSPVFTSSLQALGTCTVAPLWIRKMRYASAPEHARALRRDEMSWCVRSQGPRGLFNNWRMALASSMSPDPVLFCVYRIVCAPSVSLHLPRLTAHWFIFAN